MPPIPDMFTSGNGVRSTSPSRSCAPSVVAHAIAVHRSWVRGTPFGSASVPEVQHTVSTSEARVAPVSSSSPVVSVGSSRIPVSERVPSRGSREIANTVRSEGMSARTSSRSLTWSNPAASVVVMATTGSVRAPIIRSSCARNWIGSGVTIAPIRAAAR